MRRETDLTQDRLRSLLDYDPQTGRFTWRATKANAVGGTRAGCDMGGGRRSIRIDGRLYREHRLVWLYLFGRWPEAQIDHINCEPSDNSLENLREATQSENNRNRRVQRDGLKGVVKIGRRFYARIRADGATRHLGGFATEEAAHAAYMDAARQIAGEFARAS